MATQASSSQITVRQKVSKDNLAEAEYASRDFYLDMRALLVRRADRLNILSILSDDTINHAQVSKGSRSHEIDMWKMWTCGDVLLQWTSISRVHEHAVLNSTKHQRASSFHLLSTLSKINK